MKPWRLQAETDSCDVTADDDQHSTHTHIESFGFIRCVRTNVRETITHPFCSLVAGELVQLETNWHIGHSEMRASIVTWKIRDWNADD